MSHKKSTKNISLLSIKHIDIGFWDLGFAIWFNNWDDHNFGKIKVMLVWVDCFYDLLNELIWEFLD